VADAQFGCPTVVADAGRHTFSLEVLYSSVGHAVMMCHVFCRRYLVKVHKSFCDMPELTTLIKSSLAGRQLRGIRGKHASDR
jgi:hypothetical protein